MYIFEKENKSYILIHIPKNGGRYIRDIHLKEKSVKTICNYWGIKSNLDLAHIPYLLKDSFIKDFIDYNYFTYTRNPYDRLISAYFFKNKNKGKNDFMDFVKNILISLDFSLKFDQNIIHYYPQYLFLCDENLILQENIKIYKLENENPKRYNLTDYFDKISIQIVNQIYNKDFLLFGYDFLNF